MDVDAVLESCFSRILRPHLSGFSDINKILSDEDWIPNIHQRTKILFVCSIGLYADNNVDVVTCKQIIHISSSHDGKQRNDSNELTCRKVSQQILTALITRIGFSNVQSLLIGTKPKNSLFSHVSEFVWQSVTSSLDDGEADYREDALEKVIGTSTAYLATLLLIRHPHVEDYLARLLPLSLRFTDHHSHRLKLVGVGIIKHIVGEVDRTALNWHNRCGVLHDAIMLKCFHVKELLDEVLPLVLQLLVTLEGDPKLNRTTMTTRCHETSWWSKHDQVMSRLITSMGLEGDRVVQHKYIAHLSKYIEQLGILTSRHSSPLLDVIAAYAEYGDVKLRMKAVYSLYVFIQQCWPCIQHNTGLIVKILVRVVFDGESNSDVIKLIDICLKTMLNLAPTPTEDILKDLCLIFEDKVPSCQLLLRKLLDDCSRIDKS